MSRDCPKYENVKEGSLACEECDHWKIVKIIEPKLTIPVSIPYAVQRCELLPSIESDNCWSERKKLIDEINKITEKHRTDPESIKRKQEIYMELSKLTTEDLSKRITSNSDNKRT